MKNRAFFFLVLLTGIQTMAQEATKAHKDSLDALVQKYYHLNLKIFEANSKPGDIATLFDLFTDDFTYEHPKYGGTYTWEDLYKGYVQNQRNGAYNGTVTAIKVVTKIIGLNAAAVEKRFIEKHPNGIREGESEMTLFEFRKGKIARIVEYW